MEKKLLQAMFENLLHIWNKKAYWNPKMKSYIYGSTNWVHVFNLVKTAEKIEEVKKEILELTSAGKKVLFVSTKLQWRDIFKSLAEETGNYYVIEKWVPWLLTNFKTIKRRISSYTKLLKDSEKWDFDMLTKKEKASRLLELEKLEKAYGWLKEMKWIPDIIFVLDWVYDDQALKEAQKLWIKSFAILNTNGDVDMCDNFIPANTNAIKSLEFIASELKGSFSNKRVERKPSIQKTEGKKISWEEVKKTKDRVKIEEAPKIEEK